MQVAVHGDDNPAARVVKARRHGCSLAKIPAENNKRHIGIPLTNAVNNLCRLIRTTIINEQNLIREFLIMEHRMQFPVQFINISFFIIKRDNNRYINEFFHSQYSFILGAGFQDNDLLTAATNYSLYFNSRKKKHIFIGYYAGTTPWTGNTGKQLLLPGWCYEQIRTVAATCPGHPEGSVF